MIQRLMLPISSDASPPEAANSRQNRRERAESGFKTRMVSITASIN
jgi:hypothetical protein